MRAYITSENKEFIGVALSIPTLRKKLESMSGTISEQEVIELAKVLYIELWDQQEELWDQDKAAWKSDKDLRQNFKRLAKLYGVNMPQRVRRSDRHRIIARDRIISEDNDFIEATLKIVPLRTKINSTEDNATEARILTLAEDLYNEYRNRYENNRDEWNRIIDNDFAQHKRTQCWMNGLGKYLERFGAKICK